ncbi:hypothetical protein GCM10020000_60590 [Streptomyces olivoverticillatus]
MLASILLFLEANPGSYATSEVRPPGYEWAGKYAGYLELAPPFAINNCHLLARELSGSGTDLDNLATCSRQANTYSKGEGRLEDNMRKYEVQVKDAIDDGQVVRYQVTPKYSGSRTVPASFEMSAVGSYGDGSPGIRFDEVVPNSLWVPKT